MYYTYSNKLIITIIKNIPSIIYCGDMLEAYADHLLCPFPPCSIRYIHCCIPPPPPPHPPLSPLLHYLNFVLE